MTPLLSPLFALFTRALRDDVRSRFPIILRAVMLFVLLGLLVFTQFALRFGMMPAAGMWLLGYLATLNFVGISLLGLATFGSAITEEKEDETLGLLRMTRLNPLSIVLGKSTARLAGGLLFVAVQMPFALLCATLGGVRMGQIFEVYAILGAYLFFLCNLGLLASVICHTTARAVTMTLACGLLLFLLAPMVWFSNFALSGGIHIFAQLTGYLTASNPVLQLIDAVAGSPTLPFEANSVPFLLSGGGVCFALGWLGFERFCGGEMQLSAPARAKTTPRRGRVSRTWRRAVMWKDFYFSTGGIRGVVWRVVMYLAVIVLYLWAEHRMLDNRPLMAIAKACSFSGGIGFTIEFALAAAAIFGKERRHLTLGTLWATPISAGRLIGQKIGGYALSLAPGALLWVAGMVLNDIVMGAELSRGQPVYGYGSNESMRWAMHGYAVMQYVCFGSLIAYLLLIMRRGALVLGLLAYFLWNFFFVFILARILFIGLSGGNFMLHQATMYWGLCIALGLFTGVVVYRIPRRLAVCAAED